MTHFLKRAALVASTAIALLISSSSFAEDNQNIHDRWYAGVQTGYGNTDWHFLLPFCQGDVGCETTLSASAPLDAKDGGLFTGVYVGYQLRPHLAIEMNAVRMHNSYIDFSKYSFYPQLTNDNTSLDSKTYVLDWLAKFSTPLPESSWNLFIDVGAAATHRVDRLAHLTHINPTFGVGLDHIFQERYQIELFAQYASGFDHASLTPADSYVPFIIMGGIKVGMLF